MKPIISGNTSPPTSSTITGSTGTATTTTIKPTSTASTKTSTVSTAETTFTETATDAPGGNCTGIAPFNTVTAYNRGLYAANWWTQGETPSPTTPAWAAWKYASAC